MTQVDILTSGALLAGWDHKDKSFVALNQDVYYAFYVDSASTHLHYKKSSDGGETWASAVDVYTAGAVRAFSVYYRPWDGTTDSKIYIALADSTNGLVKFLTLDTDTDTLSAGVNVASSITVSSIVYAFGICVTHGGNILIASEHDLNVTVAMWKSTNGGTSFSATTATFAEISGGGTSHDSLHMWADPNAADDNDALCVFLDDSADQVSLKAFDDSADSVSESALGSCVFASNQISDAMRLSDGHIIVAYRHQIVTTIHLEVWDTNGTASITQKTDVYAVGGTKGSAARWHCVRVDQATDDLYVGYCIDNTGGSSSHEVYYKKSTDDASTWGSEQTYETADDAAMLFLVCDPNEGYFMPAWFATAGNWSVETTNAVQIGTAGLDASIVLHTLDNQPLDVPSAMVAY